MMYILMCTVINLAFSLATDVTVYKFDDYYGGEPGSELDPVVMSPFPLKFLYQRDDWHYMRIHIKNKSPSVSAVQVKFHTDIETFSAENYTVLHGRREGEQYYWFSSLSLENTTEINVMLNLYTSKILCARLLVATGRPVLNITNESTKKEYKNIDECNGEECVLVVDLKQKTDNANNTVIIATSLSSIALILVVIIIIAIWKRCWMKRNPPDTPQQPTSVHMEPFYQNMLFRRECDEEIAEIDQHHYEEIIPK